MNPGDGERLLRLERKIDFLFRHLGLDPGGPVGQGPELPPAFYEVLARGKKIEAIKIYRDFTGVGLAEAKKAVEAIERQPRL